MKLHIANTSRYPKPAVDVLVRFAAKTVMEVPGWLHNASVITVQVQNTRRSYSGRAWYDNCLVRIGPPEKFPRSALYGRFQDMPEHEFRDWQEALTGVAAHELMHLHLNGRRNYGKDAEMQCEHAAEDAVEALRKVRGLIDTEIAAKVGAAENRAKEQKAQDAARRAARNGLAAKLEQACEHERRWGRRLKLATTKLKAARRKVHYYERLVVAQAVTGDNNTTKATSPAHMHQAPSAIVATESNADKSVAPSPTLVVTNP